MKDSRTTSMKGSPFEAKFHGQLLHCLAAWRCQGPGGGTPAISGPQSTQPACPPASTPAPVRPWPMPQGLNGDGVKGVPRPEACVLEALVIIDGRVLLVKYCSALEKAGYH